MINLQETLHWLNELPSSISDWQKGMLADLYDPQTLAQRRQGIIDQLQHTIDRHAGPYAWIEINLRIAIYFLAANMMPQAAALLNDLPNQFEQTHAFYQQAISLWLLALIDWDECRVQNAFVQARKARSVLIHAYKKAAQVKDTPEQGLLGQRIGLMTYDLLSRPELAYWWMYEFGNEQFNEVTGQVRVNILNELEHQRIAQAQPAITRLQGMARHLGFNERCDVLAFCGYASLFLQGQHMALKNLVEAVEIARPNSHCQMALLWTIGLLECPDHRRDCEGIRFQEKSIHQAQLLCECCDHQNEQDRNLWYEFHINAMKRVLEDNINGQLRPFALRN